MKEVENKLAFINMSKEQLREKIRTLEQTLRTKDKELSKTTDRLSEVKRQKESIVSEVKQKK
jgi:chromosome segregation ATPase